MNLFGEQERCTECGSPLTDEEAMEDEICDECLAEIDALDIDYSDPSYTVTEKQEHLIDRLYKVWTGVEPFSGKTKEEASVWIENTLKVINTESPFSLRKAPKPKHDIMKYGPKQMLSPTNKQKSFIHVIEQETGKKFNGRYMWQAMDYIEDYVKGSKS